MTRPLTGTFSRDQPGPSLDVQTGPTTLEMWSSLRASAFDVVGVDSGRPPISQFFHAGWWKKAVKIATFMISILKIDACFIDAYTPSS